MGIVDKKIRILGIVATPIKKGNCNWMMDKATEICKTYDENIEVEIINLYNYEIKDCTGCEACVKHVFRAHGEHGWDIRPVPVKDYNCSIKDDMQILHQKMIDADALLLSAPTYIASIPGPLKTFIDRCRTFVHDHRLEGKMAIPMTAVFFRHCGGDSANLFMMNALSALGYTNATYGSIACSSDHGTGKKVEETRFAVSMDEMGMEALKTSVNHFMRVFLTYQVGKEALGDRIQEWKYNRW